ncbi:hypothetical protein V495_00649, partial [Pseudogymnoascus sp. VKM F-4514 (FW-929)]
PAASATDTAAADDAAVAYGGTAPGTAEVGACWDTSAAAACAATGWAAAVARAAAPRHLGVHARGSGDRVVFDREEGVSWGRGRVRSGAGLLPACYDEVVDGPGTPARESGESSEAAGGGEEVDGWGDGGDDEGGVCVTRHATAPGAEHWGSREGTREGIGGDDEGGVCVTRHATTARAEHRGSREGTREGIEEGGGEGERGEEGDRGGRGAVEYERESGEWRAESEGAAEGVVGGRAVSKFYTDG